MKHQTTAHRTTSPTPSATLAATVPAAAPRQPTLRAQRKSLSLFIGLFLACTLPLTAFDGDTLTIEQAQAMAADASGDIERAEIALEQARADTDIARSRRFPNVSGGVSGSYLFSPPEGEGIERGELGTAPTTPGELPVPIPETDVDIIPDTESTFYSVSASLEQALYTWGKVREGIEAAEHERRAVAAELESERVSVADRVNEAYFSAKLSRQTQTALSDAENTINQVVDDREEALEAGTRTRESVLEMRSQAARVRRQRISAEQSERSARRALGILLDADVSDAELTSDYRDSADPESESALMDAAMDYSPDLQALENRRWAAESALHIEERRSRLRYPDIALLLDFEVSGQQAPFRTNAADRWEMDLTLTLAVEFAIFDGGEQAARIRKAEGNLQSARSGLRDSRDGLELEVRRAYEDVITAEAQLTEQQANLEYVREQRRNAEVSFENERITREDFLFARLQETLAEIERDSTAFSLERALSGLEALTGDVFKTSDADPRTGDGKTGGYPEEPAR
ncbi:MAG: TolC family protein [Spirochaetota bacterium]